MWVVENVRCWSTGEWAVLISFRNSNFKNWEESFFQHTHVGDGRRKECVGDGERGVTS